MSEISATLRYEDRGFAAVAAKLDVLRGRVERPLSGLKKLNTAGESLMKAFAPLAPIAIGAGAAIAGVGATAAIVGIGIKKAFDLGGTLSDLSARTGASISDLVVLRQAFDNAGIGAEKVGPSINKMQKALTGINEEGEPTNKVFAQLGLNMDSLRSLSATEQFSAVGKAIGGLSSPAERSTAALALFGKSGGEMLALFTDSGALGDAAKDVGEQAGLLEKNAALFDKISDILGTTGTKIQGFFVGMADQLAPLIEPLVDLFRNTDFTGFGRRIGNAVAIAFQSLVDGSIWRLSANGAMAAIGVGVNYLWRGLAGATYAFGEQIIQSFKDAVLYFQILTKASFWIGLGQTLLGIAASFGAALLDVVANLVDALSGIPIVGDKIGQGAQAIRNQAQAARDSGREVTGAGIDLLAPIAKEIADRKGESAQAVADAFMKGFSGAGNLIDVSGLVEAWTKGISEQQTKLSNAQTAALAAQPEKKKNTVLDFATGAPKASGASRVTTISGFGAFVRDPLINLTRRTNELLAEVVANTARQRPVTLPGANLQPSRFTL